MPYDAISPDGFSISRDDTYATPDEARLAISDWAKRYEWQGFYSTARRERIPLEELPGRCRIVEAAQDEEDEF